MKILMVCLGNICRSPLAHGILEHKIAQLASSNPTKYAHWEVDSAGTINLHEGEKPDSRSISTAKNHGLDISHQRSRPFTPKDFAYLR
jgi:protein-tyrosine phosphatase